jgi:small-conductance mechanosensitive channel
MGSTMISARACLRSGFALAVLWTAIATAQQPSSASSVSIFARPGSGAAHPVPQPSALLPLTSDQVLAHVRQSVAWYRDLSGLEQSSLPGVDAIARSQLQQQALTAVRLAFAFGKAAEDILGRQAEAQGVSGARGRGQRNGQAAGQAGNSSATASNGAPTLSAQLDQAAVDLSTREAALKSQITVIDAELRRVRGRSARSRLTAQRAGTVAALQLLQQIESNVSQLRRFQESALSGQGKPPTGLRAQLAVLEQSVPELSTGEAPSGTTAAAPQAGEAAPSASGHAAASTGTSKASAAFFQPESAGVAGLIGQWFKVHGDREQLEAATKETALLAKELTATRTQVLVSVRQLVGSGLASITSGSAAQLAAQQQAIESATERLRVLSGVIIPLAEQALTLSNAESTLDGWSHMLASEESTIVSYLGLRVGFLLAWIAAVLIFSEIWRRAIFRYLPDPRRRRPFVVLRRLLVTIALVLVVIFTLVSQVGSVATYAGFVTAGLAVALQNVILAVVAYFFLIGRYGVRVGDRITLSGVTGRVVDISLLRIYLMELSGPDLHSTGRLVVLSNAVVFQPTALFKQIPGAEYLWHTVTLTIVATADVEDAYKQLEAAANKVYETYRQAIERQHALAQHFIEFETAAPVPEVRLRLTDSGLECSVRYPVVPERSARIDQQMLDALRKAVEGDEQLKLVASGALALKSAET